MLSLSFFRSLAATGAVVTALLISPAGFQGDAEAQLFNPCNFGGTPPTCNGFCANPNEVCRPNTVPPLDECNCGPSGGPGDACVLATPTACIGECAPLETCIYDGVAGCICAVPTLSEWGIIGMATLMLGGVLYHRRRRSIG